MEFVLLWRVLFTDRSVVEYILILEFGLLLDLMEFSQPICIHLGRYLTVIL